MHRSSVLVPLILTVAMAACADQSRNPEVMAPNVPQPLLAKGGEPAMRLAQPGPYAVGYRVENTVLPGSRPLRLHFWYPATPVPAPLAVYRPRLFGVSIAPGEIDPVSFEERADLAVENAPVATGGPFSAVVISSGYGALGYSQWGYAEHLASHGFVVVSMDHNGSSLDDIIVDVVNSMFGPTALQCLDGKPAPCLDDGTVVDPYPGRFEDLRFAFDALDGNAPGGVGSFLAGHVRTGGYGLMGHSSGASDALALAGGSPGYPEMQPDPRVRAIMPLGSPNDQYEQQLSVPVLLVVGTNDHITPLAWTQEIFNVVSSSPRMMVELQGNVHRAFNTDNCRQMQSAGGIALQNEKAIVEYLLFADLVYSPVMGSATDYCSYQDFTSPVDLRDFTKSITGFEVTSSSVPSLLGLDETTRIVSALATAFFKVNVAGQPEYDRFLQPTSMPAPVKLTRCFDNPAGTFCWDGGTNGYVKR